MDIYSTTQKAISQSNFHAKNKGVIVSNVDPSNQKVVVINTYGVTGATYSTTILMPPSETFLIPIRMWGLSFDSAFISGFGVS